MYPMMQSDLNNKGYLRSDQNWCCSNIPTSLDIWYLCSESRFIDRMNVPNSYTNHYYHVKIEMLRAKTQFPVLIEQAFYGEQCVIIAILCLSV